MIGQRGTPTPCAKDSNAPVLALVLAPVLAPGFGLHRLSMLQLGDNPDL